MPPFTSMRRPAFLFFLCMFLLCASCLSRKADYGIPDFTDRQIFNKEIEHIKNERETSPLRSLWRAALLVRETDARPDDFEHKDDCIRRARALFDECASYTQKLVSEKNRDTQYADALRFAESLETAYSALGLAFEPSAEFAKARIEAETAFKNLPVLPSRQADKTLAGLIQGSVTVWVDLGVKVEKGMGYAARVIGSGFFIDERGYIITNHHVIADLVDPKYEGYGKLYIKKASDSETRIPAKVIGWDKTLDLALLKTEIKPPSVFTLGSSENLAVGERIYAIGSPAGLESTITSGIVSSFDRKLLSTVSVMQIDAAVNSGNSGGPLVNEKGEVQGIVFAGLPAFQGLNFAIPVEYLKTVLELLYSGGETEHAWMGAYGRTFKHKPSDKTGAGVEILYLMPGSSASRAGLLPGDIVSAVNGKAVRNIEDLQFVLIGCRPDSLARIAYRRPAKTETAPPDDKVRADNKTAAEGKQQPPDDKVGAQIPGEALVYLDVRSEYPGKTIYEREAEYRMFYPLFGMELVHSSVGNKRKFTVRSVVKGGIADESGFSPNDPVEIIRTKLFEDEGAVYAELYTKKRKSGYLDVNFAVGAPLDSLYLF
ncbi:serine protease [Treponema sp. OMZ 840]|uniref:S1C family serine protease n=1 Tax=Treponema sp. OMZ 840 TaxID=244313 RepID=UPI003D947265